MYKIVGLIQNRFERKIILKSSFSLLLIFDLLKKVGTIGGVSEAGKLASGRCPRAGAIKWLAQIYRPSGYDLYKLIFIN